MLLLCSVGKCLQPLCPRSRGLGENVPSNGTELEIQYGDTKLLEVALTLKFPGQWLKTNGLRRLEIYSPNGKRVLPCISSQGITVIPHVIEEFQVVDNRLGHHIPF